MPIFSVAVLISMLAKMNQHIQHKPNQIKTNLVANQKLLSLAADAVYIFA